MSKDNRRFFEQKKIWSEIKDELLGCYLVPYFSKMLATKNPILYIDCFAGKGKFDDGKNGSPLTALESLDRSIAQWKTAHPFGDSMPQVCMKFIELNHACDLSENLNSQPAGRCEIISGRFEDNIIPMLQRYCSTPQSQCVSLCRSIWGKGS